MTGKLILRMAFVSLLLLGWVSSVVASSKCYITFDLNEQKSSFIAKLNNPTTEILFHNLFINFAEYLPFIFDDNGKFYPYYKLRKRKWIGALYPVYMKGNTFEEFWFDSENTVVGLIPNSNYFFFTMTRVSSETGYIISNYVISNVLSFHLDSKYKINDAKIILWSDLSKVTQESIRSFLQSYLPEMEVNLSVDYVVNELNLDKRKLKMPAYNPSVYEAAEINFRKKHEEWLRSIGCTQKEIPMETDEDRRKRDEDLEKRMRDFFKYWEEYGKSHTPIKKGEFMRNGEANTER